MITLGTDHLAEDSNPAAALAILAKTRSTFKNYRISEESLQSLDELQRAVLDRWIPMPVPASFLIHSSGELIAIYKGPVSTAQLLHDIPLANADPKTRRDAALPFPGQWVGPPTPSDPKRVASLMLDHNRLDAAIGYLARAGEFLEVRASDENHNRALGDLYFMAGTLTGLEPESQKQATDLLVRARDLIPADLRIRTELGRRYLAGGNLQGALSEFVAASAIAPSDTGLRQDIGLLHFRLGNYPQAKEYLSPIVAAYPGNGLAQYHLANTEIHLGNVPAAIAGYRNTLRSAPKLFDAANNLAWILACHPDEKLRSTEEALALAQRLCQLSGEKNPQFLDTLGVAQANAGNFRDAIASAKKAIALHPPENQQAVAAIAERVKLYESGAPYREAAWQ